MQISQLHRQPCQRAPFFLFQIAVTLLLLTASLPAQAHEILRVAVEDNYPPYSSTNKQGELVGFNVDIARALALAMDMECTITALPWTELIPDLQANKYDAAVACMAATEERKKLIDFTAYYLRSKSGYVGRKGMSPNFSPDALSNLTLTSQQETAQLAYLLRHYEEVATITRYTSFEDALQAVAHHKADLCLVPLLAGYHFITGPNGGNCDIIGEALNEDEFKHAPAHIAVRKGNDTLRERLNRAICTIRANGEYDSISRKYFPFSLY